MTFDLQRIIESKRAWRRALAQRPVAKKLAMLDALRDRALTIRASTLDKGSSQNNAPFAGSRNTSIRHENGGYIYE